jgi:hypothetical protein
MNRSRVNHGIAGLGTGLILLLVLVALNPSPQAETREQAQPPKKKPRPEGKPVAMPANPAGLNIALGLKDENATAWDGEIQVSEGRVLEVTVLRGGANAKVDGNKFSARSTVPKKDKAKKGVTSPLVGVNLDAPPSATVTVKTQQGNLEFKLADLTSGVPGRFLNDRASVERQEGAIRLTGRDTEDDYPALAKGKDGSAWLAYVEYTPAPPIIDERIKAGAFDACVATGNGDQVVLAQFDGKSWLPPLEVTDPGLSVWRPTVAVDGKGAVVVAWSQQVEGDWEVFYRRYTPPTKANPKGEWSEAVRLTKNPGSDFHVVATTDARGVVWLAWQSWRRTNFEIVLAALADKHRWSEPQVIRPNPANDWSPALAADAKGNVYVAWDTYDKGNYDVMLFRPDDDLKRTWVVASSAKFEARPSIVCDAKDRVWIAFEEGDEQWGKDYANAQVKNIKDVDGNPGNPLYLRRTIKV